MGKLTRLLVSTFDRVVAVEPADAIRRLGIHISRWARLDVRRVVAVEPADAIRRLLASRVVPRSALEPASV